ncbi:MAG: ABC transporter permease [Alistipes sp.]|nr:ABC transporter permease [Alistipes sp.]
MKKIYLIVSREYLERVRKKSFIVVTLLMPLFMIGMMLAPTLMMLYSGGSEQKRVMVVDRSGVVVDRLYSSPEVEYVDVSEMTKAEACAVYNDEGKAFGILYIGSVVDARDSVQLITNTSSSMILEENIANQISSIIEQDKLLSYNIENIDEILASVKTDITLSTYLNNGSGEEATMESTSSGMNYALGIILGMLLYMIIIIYGQMVLTSVVEEKASRVIDVMVTSCTPFQLMMGKILGIAAVAVTQIAIWALLVLSASKFLLPALLPADVAMTNDAMLSTILGTLGDVGYLAMLFTYMLLFILGGFLLYASLYAAAGSAVDSVQDGQQYNTIIMLPIILSIIVMMSVFNDPNSSLAFWTSVIPFTSPIVMMARIPFGIPTWEILLSLVLLYATFIFTTWLASKIFRVGIFMHGKRPSWRELWQWIRSA